MNIPKEAIEKAIEGGWKLRDGFPPLRVDEHANGEIGYWYKDDVTPHEYRVDVTCQEIALDPSFWQSLGKALGWDAVKYTPVEYKRLHPSGAVTTEFKTPIENWHEAALAFYDLILTGGDTKAFWDDLLRV